MEIRPSDRGRPMGGHPHGYRPLPLLLVTKEPDHQLEVHESSGSPWVDFLQVPPPHFIGSAESLNSEDNKRVCSGICGCNMGVPLLLEGVRTVG